jgi:hypothetical protein
MDSAPSTPQKRARSIDIVIPEMNDVVVDSTNPDAFPLFPSTKKHKITHRWLHDDPGLVEYLNNASLDTPKTPSARIVRTAGENGATIIAGKRTYYHYDADVMDEDSTEASLEFEFPKISTPESVKGFTVLRDNQSTEGTPTRFRNISATRVAFDDNAAQIAEAGPRRHLRLNSPPSRPFRVRDGIINFDPEPDMLAEDADDERSELDDSFQDDARLSDDDDSDKQNSSIWIRRRTNYGIVLAPQTEPGEKAYETSDDERERFVGDVTTASSDHESTDTVMHYTIGESRDWTEAEEKVFRALVWDYGRKWVRFLPFFPDLTMRDVS